MSARATVEPGFLSNLAIPPRKMGFQVKEMSRTEKEAFWVFANLYNYPDVVHFQLGSSEAWMDTWWKKAGLECISKA